MADSVGQKTVCVRMFVTSRDVKITVGCDVTPQNDKHLMNSTQVTFYKYTYITLQVKLQMNTTQYCNMTNKTRIPTSIAAPLTAFF